MNISENESSVFFIICTFCENYTETIKHLPVFKIACNHAKELIEWTLNKLNISVCFDRIQTTDLTLNFYKHSELKDCQYNA